jgi:hypothetical protein
MDITPEQQISIEQPNLSPEEMRLFAWMKSLSDYQLEQLKELRSIASSLRWIAFIVIVFALLSGCSAVMTFMNYL